MSQRRGSKHRLDALHAYGAIFEEEPRSIGNSVSVATILLTNRECPWKCVFCDLWKNTLDETVPSGAIPEQIRTALADLPPAGWIKLYNAGSFFDPRAIPPEDFAAIVDLLAPFERVIVECHPALIDGGVGSRVLRFRDLLRALPIDTSRPIDALRTPDPGFAIESRFTDEVGLTHASGLPNELNRTLAPEPSLRAPHTDTSSRHMASEPPKCSPVRCLEVAMGLETVHPFALERLNKGMTLDDFARAAEVLRRSDIDLRAFVMVQPPFTPPDEAVHWALRSLDFARDQGARLVAFIPTRGGNGAMEALAAEGHFVPPRLATLEEVIDRALESASSPCAFSRGVGIPGVVSQGDSLRIDCSQIPASQRASSQVAFSQVAASRELSTGPGPSECSSSQRVASSNKPSHGVDSQAVSSRRGPIVVADLWDLERFSDCPACFSARSARLCRMNLSQVIEPRILCHCSSGTITVSRSDHRT